MLIVFFDVNKTKKLRKFHVQSGLIFDVKFDFEVPITSDIISQ